jgi:rhodanese-related sulfurtransferase
MNTLKEVSLLVAVSLAAALISNYLSPVGIALVGQWDETRGVVTAMQKDNEVMQEFEIDDPVHAKALYDTGNVLFVDARPPDDYGEGHIKGSVSLPTMEFDRHIDTFMQLYDLDKPMVTYCSGRTCEDSHHLAQLLMERGYLNISVMIDGFSGWQAKGYPIEWPVN